MHMCTCIMLHTFLVAEQLYIRPPLSVRMSGCPKFFERRRETSYDVARLLLMVPLEPWQNSTPVFGAAAFCTTKIDDFRASSTLSSLTTWLRRPLRKDQLGGTKRRYFPTFKMHNLGTVPMFKMHNIGTVPTYKMHNVGTVPTYKTHNIGTELSFVTLKLEI